MNDLEKAEAIHKRMLNQFGISELIKLNVYKDLALALNARDYADLEENNIYFNPLFSPASQSDLVINLPKGAKIITLDINLYYSQTQNSTKADAFGIGEQKIVFREGDMIVGFPA